VLIKIFSGLKGDQQQWKKFLQ